VLLGQDLFGDPNCLVIAGTLSDLAQHPVGRDLQMNAYAWMAILPAVSGAVFATAPVTVAIPFCATRRLDELGGRDELRSRLGIANAKLAYQQYLELFSGARWEMLKIQGARPQRCRWASTSVKDPRSPDTMYVEQLAGAETVNTMPPETLDAVQDHGTIAGQTIDRDLDDAQRLFAALAGAGIDYTDITGTLEDEGVKKFADSFDQLFENIETKRDQLATASRR
jgi:transaldolase